MGEETGRYLSKLLLGTKIPSEEELERDDKKFLGRFRGRKKEVSSEVRKSSHLKWTVAPLTKIAGFEFGYELSALGTLSWV